MFNVMSPLTSKDPAAGRSPEAHWASARHIDSVALSRQ